MNKSQLLVYLFRAIAMLVAIPVHESAHALVSDRLGDPTAKNCGRITLNPMAHFDLWGSLCLIFVGFGWARPVPINTRNFKNPRAGMALTAIAGPISNLILAYIAVVLYKLIWYLAPDTMVWEFLMTLMMYFAAVDVALAVFNMLPVPPFDGSRLFTAFLPPRLYFGVMRYERYIYIGIFVLLMLGVLSTPLSIVQGWMWNFLSWSTGFVDKLLYVSHGSFV